ncbi:MAG: urease accessory protein UreE [Dongiaceae bacterium]
MSARPENRAAKAASPTGEPLRLTRILGGSDDPAMADRLHDLSHAGRIQEIALGRDDLARRRIRIATDAGTDCAIALDRSEKLFDGAVLLLEADRAVVVRMEPERWLSLETASPAAALRLGYFAGNMHWRVRFEGNILHIALEGATSDYLARLDPVLRQGGVRAVVK